MLCLLLDKMLIHKYIRKIIPVNLAIFQTMPIFVHELFETMQSSVTESRTFATKSLPVSFKYCNYLLIYSELQQNTKLLL